MGNEQYSIEFFFKALADRTRLRILNLIDKDEICVCSLVEVLNVLQPKISRHLAYLRRARIVVARREGKLMYYRIIEPPDAHAAIIFHEVCASLTYDPEMNRDRARLSELCCTTKQPLSLSKAPRPLTLAQRT